MAININQYVNINSGVAGVPALTGREFIGRVFTTNALLPPQSYLEFPSAQAVGSYFGFQSEEYYRALFYYSFTSKSFTQPQNLSFARWAQAAIAPMIFGFNNPVSPQSYANYSAIATGSIGITIGGIAHQFSNLDFTAAVNLTGVAAVLQSAISGIFAGTTVVYNAPTGNFILTGGTAGAAMISVQPGATGIDISGANLISWYPQATLTGGVFAGNGAIWANGSAAETIPATLTSSSNLSNNFGSFCFMPIVVGGVTSATSATVMMSSAPMIVGYVNPASPQVLSKYTGISTGSIGITIGGTTNNFTGLDFTAQLSLNGVAGVLQTAISGIFAGTTVVYNAVSGVFVLTGGTPGAAMISVQPGVGGVDISGANFIAWYPQAAFPAAGAQWINGMAGDTAGIVPGMYVNAPGIPQGTTVLTVTASTSITISQVATLSLNEMIAFSLSIPEIVAAATWAESENVMFDYQVPVIQENYAAVQTAVQNIGSVGLTLSPPITPNAVDPGNQYPEMFPMMIQAATNYDAPGSVQNYEFQQVGGLLPSVTTDAQKNIFDPISVNYYGQTQQAGQFIAFYQQGFLQGLATDPLDMGIFANEIWLKDAATVALMNLLLAQTQVPANKFGTNLILTILQGVINQAVLNGTIEVGKTLTPAQIAFIVAQTNDPAAQYQIQTLGYWVNASIVATGSPPIYTATYTLLYSKDDTIRKVNGTDILI